MESSLLQSFAASPFGQFVMEQNLFALAPEVILVVALILTIFLSMNESVREQEGAWSLSFFGVLLALISLLMEFNLFVGDPTQIAGSLNVLFGMLKLDGLSWFARVLMLSSTLVLLFMSRSYVKERLASVSGEFYTLLLTALLGAMFLAGANDLVMLFVSLETLGIMSYLLAGYLRNDMISSEASLKYLLYGGASSAVFLFGLSILYGLMGGSTNLSDISTLATPAVGLFQSFIPVMVVMLTVGMGFKLSAAPFQWWTPDVYEGSPTPITAFLSVVSKVAAFAFVVRLVSLLTPVFPDMTAIISVLAIASMVLGNAVALFQTNVKRLLAYSSVAHVGYLLVGLLVFSASSLSGVWYYLTAYAFMNLGAFACVMQASKALGSDASAAYAGLVQKKPFLVFSFAVFLLALAGIPITSGFFAKFFLFQSVVITGDTYLPWVIIALLASTVSLYYYLNLIRIMVVAPQSPEVEAIIEEPGFRFSLPSGLTTAVTVCLVLTIALGFVAPPLYQVAQNAVGGLTQKASFLSQAK